jgi:endonuclease/exonuclease/phosphatase family metal-dependent hydrolase
MKRDYKVNSFYLLNDRLHVEWANVDNKDLYAFDGFERRLAGTAIKEANKMRHGLRLATFNAYGTGSAGVKNWTAIKEHLEQYGVDIVGFQEIYKPNTTNVDGKTFAEALTSWNLNTFAVIDENIDTNCRPVAAISGFTVASTVEVKYTRQSNYGDRYYTKTELLLPRWMDKKWSENLKMSVYNTQLELSATTGVVQAQELVAAILTDTNPFIVITGDFNDESYAKNVWKVFTDAGFTPAINNFDSPTAGRGWYDNIFVNDRIAIKEHDIVPSDLVTYKYSGVSYVISDHDLVTADVVLDYSNIVTITHRNCDVSVTGTKDGVTTTLNSDWFDRRAGHITIVASNPAEGYTLTGMAVWDGDWSLPNNKYPTGIVTIDGATVEFNADEIIGDFVVNAAQA